MPILPVPSEAETSQAPAVQASLDEALACVESLDRPGRLFVLLDALVSGADAAAGAKLVASLMQKAEKAGLGVLPYVGAEAVRAGLDRSGVIYQGRHSWCGMRPELRFELCRQAVQDPDAARLLKTIRPKDKALGADAERLGLAQTAAMYANDDALFAQLYRLKPALLQRRVHLRLAAPSSAWLEERKGLVKKVAADDAVKSLLFAGAASPMLGWISRSLAEGGVPAVQAFHPVSKAAVHLWSGRWQEAEAELAGLAEAETYWQTHCLRGLERLLHGDAACLAHFKRAEEIYGRDNPGLLSSLPSLPLFAKKLAAFLFGGEDDLASLRLSLENAESRPPSRVAELWDGRNGLQAMRALDCLRQGQEAKGRFILFRLQPLEENWLAAMLYYGALQCLGMLDPAKPALILPLQSWHARLEGLPAVQGIAGALLARALGPEEGRAFAPGPQAAGLLDFADLVKAKTVWQVRLSGLEEALRGQDGRPEDRPVSRRLVWVASRDLSLVEPREQALGDRGWNSPRPASLKRLREQEGEGWMTPGDRRVLACAEARGGWADSPLVLRLENCCEALEGLGSVYYDGEAGLEPLQVKRGALKLRLASHGASCRLAFDGFDCASADVESAKAVFLRRDGVLTYFKLSLRERRVVHAVGQGIELPQSAIQRVLDLPLQDAGIPLRCEIEAGEMPADPTPVIQLEQEPAGGGFSARVGVRPFGRPGTPFFPTGEGSPHPLSAVAPEGGGDPVPMRAVRDFAAEKFALEALAAGCPALACGLDEQVWRSQKPEEVLELLEELKASDLASHVEWPRGRAVRLAGSLRMQGVTLAVARGRGRDWFSLSGEARVGEGRVVAVERLLQSLSGSRFVALGDGEYLALADELRRRLSGLQALMDEGAGEGKLQFSPLAAPAVEEMAQGMHIQADADFAACMERMHGALGGEPEVPDGLMAELRPYQREGVQWLLRLARWGAGACLADDMGLGKTVQTIACLLGQASRGPCLVVAPATVCTNWEKELARFAPRLSARRLGLFDRGRTVKAMGRGDVLIVGYGLLPNAEEELASVRWAMAVFDEAQALKNPLTKRASAAREIRADFRLALTGTPIENRIEDLWSIFAVIAPGLLGGFERFKRRFGQAAPGTPAGKALRQLVRPFLLRRLKSAVLDELPARTEQNIVIEPSEDEKAFYELMRRRAVDNVDRAPGSQKRFLILAWLTKLRLACCSPALADEELAQRGRPGALSVSCKLDRLLEVLEELLAGGHKALVFSQFTSFLKLVRKALERAGISSLYLDGQTSEKARRERVDSFQQGSCGVFLLSLKAGGTGINLTAADYVVHLDPWWNPAVEDQASDRAHRIGQRRPVTVYRFVMAGTVEEKILAMHREKRDLAASFLEGADQTATRISDEELLNLLR